MDNIQNVINDTTDVICYIEQAKAVISGIQAIMDNFSSPLDDKIADSLCAVDTLIALSHAKAVSVADILAEANTTEKIAIKSIA